jgi:hypothetical protein
MILHGYVKQYNNKKKCDFYLKRGDFMMFLKISQLNGPLIAKTNHQNIHPQLIHMTLQGH